MATKQLPRRATPKKSAIRRAVLKISGEGFGKPGAELVVHMPERQSVVDALASFLWRFRHLAQKDHKNGED